MKYNDQKQVEKERIYLAYTSIELFNIEGIQDRNPELNLGAGDDAEAMEGCCLLAYSPWLAQPAFL